MTVETKMCLQTWFLVLSNEQIYKIEQIERNGTSTQGQECDI